MHIPLKDIVVDVESIHDISHESKRVLDVMMEEYSKHVTTSFDADDDLFADFDKCELHNCLQELHHHGIGRLNITEDRAIIKMSRSFIRQLVS